MYVHRQSLWLCFAVLLSACSAIDPMPYIYDRSPFSLATQNKGNAHCASLYGDGQLRRLEGKMPLHLNELPTRAMLGINTVPSVSEISAIRVMESLARTCREMRKAAGEPTSATEDILQARISKLRFALYRGDIPYAVYNYGLAQALKSYTAFLHAGEAAAQKGREAGQRTQLTAMAMEQSMMLNARLNHYNSIQSQRTWVCGPSVLSSDLMDCR